MRESQIPLDALKAAINELGSQSAMARLVGVSQPSVSDWVRRIGQLPAEHVLTVEAATGISRHVLRPDIYPIEEIASPGAIPGVAPSTSNTSEAGGVSTDPLEGLRS